MSWDHGYFAGAAYVDGFYREMAPQWIDFAALLKGHNPPRPGEGAPFSYLDLGCGTGFGLCLLAALHPEGRFTGVDFQPGHIAQGQWLSRQLDLTNVTFLEADFLTLQADSTPLGFASGQPGPFHYVAAHGIATWVTETVQNALLALASAALRPGGLFYCSYNTLPGWLPKSVYQHLVQEERQRADPAAPIIALQRASATLLRLLHSDGAPTPLGLLLPSLREGLEALPSQNQRYLSQEYANEGWEPLHVAEMHRRCERHKLTYHVTAELPAAFENLLPPHLQAILAAESSPRMRQTLIDLATAKAFRKDLFVKGVMTLPPPQRDQRFGSLRLRRIFTVPLDTYTFATSFGSVRGNGEICRRIEAELADRPRSLAALAAATGLPMPELLKMVALLLHDSRVGLDRGEAGEAAVPCCQRVNAVLQQLMIEGSPYEALTAARIGSTISSNSLEAMLALGHGQGLRGDMLALCVQAGLAGLEAHLLNEEGQPHSDPARELEDLIQRVATFEEVGVPLLQSLGVLPA
jgi:SAM-dependent methyltransferase